MKPNKPPKPLPFPSSSFHFFPRTEPYQWVARATGPRKKFIAPLPRQSRRWGGDDPKSSWSIDPRSGQFHPSDGQVERQTPKASPWELRPTRNSTVHRRSLPNALHPVVIAVPVREPRRPRGCPKGPRPIRRRVNRLAWRRAISGRESSLFNRLQRHLQPTFDGWAGQSGPEPIPALEAGKARVEAPPE